MTDQHATDDGDLCEIEVEDLAGLMCRLEERHHQLGWRKSALTVYVVVDRHRHRPEFDIITRAMRSLGPAIVVGRYGAQPMIIDRTLARADMPPWEALWTFAHNVAFTDAGQLAESDMENREYLIEALGMMRHVLQLPGIIAFAAVQEGYGLDEASPALIEEARNADIETLPGAREGRLLILVDAGDQVHKVQRVRGHDHAMEMFAPIRGDTTNSLRKLMDFAMDRLPTTQQEADDRYKSIGKTATGLTGVFQYRLHQSAG